MSITVNSINPIQSTNQIMPKEDKKSRNEKNKLSSKVVLSGLALLGVTTLAIIKLKGKGSKGNDIKSLAGKKIKVKGMTPEEKEKLIKELQSKTDNPATKEEIRKLIESGEWDNLG